MQGYPEEGGATEAPDAGASSGDFPAAIKSHFSPVGQHSGGAEGAASAPREARDPRADGVYGALDLGTNNCRLLLARPSRRGFRVVDAFSRIIRLGEGVSQTGRLSEPAMARTLDALKVCAAKLGRAKVRRSRLVATEACRIAENGGEFLARVRDKLGLDIEILTRELEARLAVSGSAALIDASCDYVLVFDIGGGSSELILLDLTRRSRQRDRRFAGRLDAQHCMVAWTSLPMGVETVAERFGGRQVAPADFEAMVAETQQ
ncbi:MAG: Ppx/GppA family phosphatase, partial [Hyphomicrobium sp.]|nr:Ppx/GppA family phosphatase [Hyphomicrobium sp.]